MFLVVHEVLGIKWNEQYALAFVMQRFGVLLAVNSVAHRLWPFLPVVDAYEKQLVEQWAAFQPTTSGVDTSGISG